MRKIELLTIPQPEKDCGIPVMLSDQTIEERKEKVLAKMRKRNLDQLIIYGDVEHGSNFMYLTGYFTRFEESLLVIQKDGKMTLVLGNESLNKAEKARIENEGIHVPQFSLPNQPDERKKTMKELLEEAGIGQGQRIGVVGWKNFASTVEDGKKMFDLPEFIMETIRSLAGDAFVTNETDLFIGEDGVRTVNNANEIAHYEYGASLASDCVLDAMNRVKEGVSELELGDCLMRNGQYTNVVTIAAAGERFVKGNMFPTVNTVKKGDPLSLTVGYYGGLSSRAGMAVQSEADLADGQKDYLEKVAIPYFKAYVAWLEQIRIGMEGKELFQIVEEVLPRATYGWTLCPGHLTAEEEWLASPVYETSKEKLKSGMIFQIDIIPSVPGYAGVGAESTVVLASDKLKEELQTEYPEMFVRMLKRKAYMKEVLGICVSDDIMPMCSTVAYLRPYLLDHEKALALV